LSKLRVVFATVALGMGIDIPCIRHVIHIGPPHTIREYFQETGRAGLDRKQSTAVLYYNKRDIAMSRPGISVTIREYWKLEESCLNRFTTNITLIPGQHKFTICNMRAKSGSLWAILALLKF
jgi:superfamily II DNA helicase RecQ